MNIGHVIQSLMAENGYTMYRLAKLVGCKQTTVKNWIDGTTEPQPIYFQKLAEIFNVSVAYLKGETDDRGETKKAPTVSGERPEVLGDDRASFAARTTVMVELFEQLSVEDQNDVLFHLLEKARGLPAPDEHR